MLVRHNKRQEGKSNYTLHKLIRLWLNMFLNFSIKPLRISSFVGVMMTLLGAFLGVSVIVEKIMDIEHQLPLGWSSTIIVILFFSGMQLVILGLLGEYLGSMFLSHNQTLQFVVRSVQNDQEADSS